MEAIHRQRDMPDMVCQPLKFHLPGCKGACGGNARDLPAGARITKGARLVVNRRANQYAENTISFWAAVQVGAIVI